ncbi:MAG TPA: acyl-CoA desaturase [Terriglobia bacterium]|nr:acyl-CoA desaturase [Terriglobia bacterium]
MYLKTAIILTWTIVSYAMLVFWAPGPIAALPFAISLALSMAGVGFCIQHDGGHRGYSNRAWVNKATAFAMDILGGSSYVWHFKHNVQHHCYTNIVGVDSDINFGSLCRMAPQQSRFWPHRFQHLYMWFFYGLVTLRWHWWHDFYALAAGHIDGQKFPRPKGAALVTVIAGKALFLTFALALPMFFHRWWVVVAFYGLVTFLLGITIAVIFVLAHCVSEATFAPAGPVDSEWAAHQIETTVDFARSSRFLNWYLGGLNLQVEHHLFPNICHVHYPALAEIVEDVSRQFGVRYAAHPTMWDAVRSHYRMLRELGRAPRAAFEAEFPG